MSDNIIPFPGQKDMPVQVVLDGASAVDMENILVIAKMKNGEYYFAATCWEKIYLLHLVEALIEEIEGG